MNISSDKILLSINDTNIFLERNDLERTLPHYLKDIYDKYSFDEIFVLNGPGGFTSLRIGTLSVNMLNFVYQNTIKIYDISKIAFYSQFVKDGLLPDLGIIYIGQQKNFWLYDFATNTYRIIGIEGLQFLKEDYFVDQIYGEPITQLNSKRYVDIQFGDEIKFVFGKRKSLKPVKNFNLVAQYQVAPNYMIAPNISIC